MFECDHTLERRLFAFSHRDLIAEDSDVWLYIDLFDHCDFDEFDCSYSSQGQAAKDPKLILRTIFYALTHGICSGRKLAEVCRNDNRFIVLSGDTQPDRRTFDRFIRRHEGAIDSFFVQVVGLAQRMGLVSLGRVAIDGSKFRAHAGKAMRYDKMTRAIDHIREDLKVLKASLQKAGSLESTELSERLKKDIVSREKRLELIRRAKEQIDHEYAQSDMKESKKKKRKPQAVKPLHDPEALSLGASAKFPFGYNAQAAVDEDSQIVVSAHLADTTNDCPSLGGLLDEMQSHCGKSARQVLADSGYNSYQNLRDIKERGSTPYISNGKEYTTPSSKALEQVRKHRDHYQCLQGKTLTIKTQNEDRVIFALNPQFCRDCSFKDSCQLYGKKSCEIPNGKKGRYLKQYYRRSRTIGFQNVYRRRKAIVEPVFGNIKNKGIKIYHRGKKKIEIFWKMACTAHNIEKIIKSGRLATV